MAIIPSFIDPLLVREITVWRGGLRSALIEINSVPTLCVLLDVWFEPATKLVAGERYLNKLKDPRL
jgi:hypothetical protein